MRKPTTRDQVIESLKWLPADASIDDAIERLIFLAKIEAGLADLHAGKSLPRSKR